jgi:hypothetical protein
VHVRTLVAGANALEFASLVGAQESTRASSIHRQTSPRISRGAESSFGQARFPQAVKIKLQHPWVAKLIHQTAREARIRLRAEEIGDDPFRFVVSTKMR